MFKTLKKLGTTVGTIWTSIRERGAKAKAVTATLLQTFAVVNNLVSYLFMGKGLESLAKDNQTNSKVSQDSIYYLLASGGTLMAAAVSSAISKLLTSSLKNETSVVESSKVAAKISKLDMEVIKTRPVGSYVQLTRQVLLTQEAVPLWIDEMYPSMLELSAANAGLIYLNWQLGLALFGAQVLSLVGTVIGTQSTDARYNGLQRQGMRVFGQMVERVEETSNIRHFSQTQAELKNACTDLEDLATGSTQLARLPEYNAMAQSVWGILASGGMIALAIAKQVGEDKLPFNYFTMLIIYLLQLNKLLAKTSRTTSQLLICHAGMLQTRDFLNLPSRVPLPATPGSMYIDNNNASVEFKGVSFRYGEESEAVLDNISFKIKPGSKTVIVGMSGGGKSTLNALMLREYLPQSGTIFIGDTNVSSIEPEPLAKVIAVVPQRPRFAGTLADALRYAKPDIDEKVMIEILQQVKLNKYANIESLSKPLGQGGVKLSGGEMQRVAIARAMLKKPFIYILDEPTSALDATSTADVMAALDEHTAGTTTIHITHDLLSISSADDIIVIDKGKVIQQGTFAALKADSNGWFYKLLSSACSLRGLDIDKVGEMKGEERAPKSSSTRFSRRAFRHGPMFATPIYNDDGNIQQQVVSPRTPKGSNMKTRLLTSVVTEIPSPNGGR